MAPSADRAHTGDSVGNSWVAKHVGDNRAPRARMGHVPSPLAPPSLMELVTRVGHVSSPRAACPRMGVRSRAELEPPSLELLVEMGLGKPN